MVATKGTGNWDIVLMDILVYGNQLYVMERRVV